MLVPLIVGFLDPDLEAEETLCISKRFFGITCPGCGLFKSFVFAYKGDFSKSVYYHPLGMFLLIIIFYATALAIYDYFKQTDKWMRFADSLSFWRSLVIAFFVIYIYRGLC